MTQAAIVIPGGDGWPSLCIHVNPLYALYHYLASEAQQPEDQRYPSTAEAAALMRRARTPSLLHGVWGSWEEPLAKAGTVDGAADGLHRAMTGTLSQLTDALRQAEPEFRDVLWPQRMPMVDGALATLREHIVPHFPPMARRQGNLLRLTWPSRIDAFLVTDCHAWQGGYSKPFTVDVARITGLELCETIVHEATHVADVHTNGVGNAGQDSFKNRLVTYLRQRGVPSRTAWDTWHAVIFAASAEQIRTVIDANYQDYALTHNSPSSNLYSRFKLPDLPVYWSDFTEGRMSEAILLDAIARDLAED